MILLDTRRLIARSNGLAISLSFISLIACRLIRALAVSIPEVSSIVKHDYER